MGFTVTEALSFPRYGVTAAGCYVTIRATYYHNKVGSNTMGMPMPMPSGPTTGPYVVTARWHVYAANDVSLAPLREESIVLNLETAPANPIVAIYNEIKTQHFAGKTCTDDL